ncbi:MAG TPA: Ig-like domain repeat protein [Terriglobales bacterium]
MLRPYWNVPSRCIAHIRYLLAGWVCFLFICGPTAWCLPPSVVFNGVAAVLDTGSAPLNHPKGVFVDNAGNVYIADTAHHQLVKMTPAGDASVLIITGLSTGLSAPERLARDDSGNLYVADTGNNRVVLVTSAGAGSVVNLGGVTLSAPRGVTVDAADNLYIADTGNNRIIKIPSGGAAAVLTITGLGTGLSAPMGLAADAAGNLYVADSGNNRIVQVTNGGAGSALSISGLGTALSAPAAVAVDSFANLFIADSGNNRVVKVTSGGAGSVLSTGGLTLNAPVGVAVDASAVVYVADTANSRVAALMTSAVGFGELQVGASSGKSLTLPFTIGVAATLGSVQALLLGTQSLDFTLGAGTTCTNGTTNTTCNVEVQFLPLAAGLRRGAVALFDQSSTLLAFVPIYGTGGAPLAALSPGTASIITTGGVSLSYPFQAAIDGSGNIYVGNYNGNNVVKIVAGGGSASVVSTGAYTLNEAAGVAVDGAGNLYIADYGNNRIVQVKSTGAASVLAITGLGTAINQPAGLALDGAGNLYIADWGNSRIVKVTPAGAGVVVATGSYTLTASGITGVAVDPSGNIYIADRIANHIVKVAPSGAASLVSVTGLTLSNPQGVAADGNGNLYIADSGHRRIVRLTTAGTATIIQTPGLTIGTIMYGVTADGSGNIFAVDWSNNRVLKVNVSSAALSFANTRIGATSTDSPKTVTVTNLGNQALAFSDNPSYTADFSENSSDTNLCTSSTSLDPGEGCEVSVMFTPHSAGSLSASVAVTDNHLNGSAATQSVAVSGTGLNLITPTILLELSANPVLISSSVVFTVTVSSSASTPTGSVEFYDGTTLLGSGELAAGVATYSSSSLTSGTHSITAAYGGDSDFSSLTSSAVSLVVSDLSVDVASGGNSSATVSAGGTATYHLAVGPSNGSVFPAAVTLSASGGPTGSTIAITPETIAAGAGVTNVTVTVQVPATIAAARVSNAWALMLALPFMGLLALPFGADSRRRCGKQVLFTILLLICLGLTGATLACGNAAHVAAPPSPTNYTITVTATSGSVSHSTSLTLRVQ